MKDRRWLGIGVLVLGFLGVAGVAFALVTALAGEGGSAVDEAAVGEETAEEWLEIAARLDVPFERLDGSRVTLREFHGRLVVLNFWGTWCPPCRHEIPELVKLQEALPEDFGTVVGVAIQSGTPKEIRRFAGEYAINYPIWISDSQTALQHYTAVGYPYTLLIDGDGVIRKQYLGPQTFETLSADIEALTATELRVPAGG